MDKSFYDDCYNDPEFFDTIEKHGFDEEGNIKFRVKRVQYAVITYTKEEVKEIKDDRTGIGDFIQECEMHEPKEDWETDSDLTRIDFWD